MTQILNQLQIDQTFIIQFALFAAFFFVLSFIYLKPFQKLIEKRNHKLKNDVQAAGDLLKLVDQKLAEYEKSLSETRNGARVAFEKAIQEARSAEDNVINSHKDELKKEYLKNVQALQEEKLKVESELKLQANQLSDLISQKILTGK